MPGPWAQSPRQQGNGLPWAMGLSKSALARYEPLHLSSLQPEVHQLNQREPAQEALGNFYDCRITLKTAVVRHGCASRGFFHRQCTTCACWQDPVCTPEGFVYSRDAIIENLGAQKKMAKRKLAAWEQQQEEAHRRVRSCDLLYWLPDMQMHAAAWTQLCY